MNRLATVHLLIVSGIFLAAGVALAGEVGEVGRDTPFVAYANGIVEDTRTKLEWIAGPDVDTSYYQAVEWVRGLKVAGGRWRMPTTKELNTLYKKPGVPSSITPLLKTTGIHVWTYQGDEDLSLYLFRYMDPFGTRGFAVRFVDGD